MDTGNGNPLSLVYKERLITFVISISLLMLSVWLIISPPMRLQDVVDQKGLSTTTSTQGDQSTVVVALITSSAALLFFAINGRRLTRFSAGPISGESSPGMGSVPARDSLIDSSTQRSQEVEKDAKTVFETLSEEQKKILRTLWCHQLRLYPDLSRRWTFRIFASEKEYPDYLIAVGDLLKRGLISVNPANDQSALEERAIIMLRILGDEIKKGPIYSFKLDAL